MRVNQRITAKNPMKKKLTWDIIHKNENEEQTGEEFIEITYHSPGKIVVTNCVVVSSG